MEIKDYKVDSTKYQYAAFDEYFKDLSVGFFDIETTGLYPDHCNIVLAGLVMPACCLPDSELADFSTTSCNDYIARQYFANDLEEEAQLIAFLINDLQKLDVVVTYNGAHFDIPFLQKRIQTNGLPTSFNLPYNLDLYRLVKYHSNLKEFLPNLKQKTLEDFLGLWVNRDDEIDGAQSVKLYFEWLYGRDENTKETILLHNRDDIMQLTRLMKVIPKTNFHKAMKSFGFPYIANTNTALHITDITANKKQICISGEQLKDAVEYVFFGDEKLSFVFNRKEKTFEITGKLHERGGIVFADPEDYTQVFDLNRKHSNDTALENRNTETIFVSGFGNDPTLLDGFPILKNKEIINYRTINKLVKILIVQILNSLSID